MKTKAKTIGRPKNAPTKGWSGDALTVLRIRAEIHTMTALANMIGASPSAVQRWESGECAPTEEQAAKLCKILKCKPAALGREPRGVEARAMLRALRGSRA